MKYCECSSPALFDITPGVMELTCEASASLIRSLFADLLYSTVTRTYREVDAQELMGTVFPFDIKSFFHRQEWGLEPKAQFLVFLTYDRGTPAS